MQAIILAAGMGKRLGDLTKDDTKCMIKVNGVPLIDRMLSQLDRNSFKRIIIVTGYKGESLKEHIGTLNVKTPIIYVSNPIYDKTNNIYSLFLAKDYLAEMDTILFESDLIFEETIIPQLIESKEPNLVLVAKYKSWMDGTVVQTNQKNEIINFIGKKDFDYLQKDTYYKTVNIYKFSKDFLNKQYIPFLTAYCSAMGHNEYYEQVLKVISSLEGSHLKTLTLDKEKWYEIDDIQDLDIAEALFAEEENQLPLFEKRYGGYWRFPHLLDYCYLVNPYFPPQKLIDELKSNFEDLLRQYPSGLRVNNLLAGKYFHIKEEYITVGNGAAELIKAAMQVMEGKIGLLLPTFEEYINRLEENQIEVFIPENADFSYTVEDLIQFYQDKTINNLILINPDNPSGNFIPKQDILKLCDWCLKKDIVIVIDESFIDFSDNYEDNSIISNDILEQYGNLIVIKSISKSYGVPGLRLGVICTSNSEIMDKIKKDVAIWNINSFGENYMQIYGKYENDYQRACREFTSERERFYNDLKQINWMRVIPSQANYFLCELDEDFNSTSLMRYLLYKHNILIKDCSTKQGFNGRNFIRIAIRDEKDNTVFVNALKEIETI